MSKLSKFKEIMGIALPIAGMLPIPGASTAAKVAEILNGGNSSTTSAAAITKVAEINDRQDEMFFTMAQEIAALKSRIAALEK